MKLESLRKEIDVLDKEVLNLLNKRKKVVESIFKVKSEMGLSVRDIEREKKMFKARQKWGKNYNPNFIKKLFELLISNSLKGRMKK